MKDVQAILIYTICDEVLKMLNIANRQDGTRILDQILSAVLAYSLSLM